VPDSADLHVAAIVLAAGEARRFGGPKLAMPFGGSTILGSAVSALVGAAVDPIVIVCGPNAPELERLLADCTVTFVQNPDPSRGMLSSVQVGLAAMPEETDRFLVALGDQPRVRAEHVGRLLDEHQASGRGIAIPTHGGKRGHPVVFDRRYRDEILQLDASRTLRDLVHANSADIVEVEFSSDAVIRDIDTERDYQDELRRALAEQ
jgi:molybdenum cofactor cytidylyltransferase